MAYTTEAHIENYALTDILDSFSGQISDWIDAAEAYIDGKTGRTFEAQTQTRYYSGSGSRRLVVDDMTQIDNVMLANDKYGDSRTEVLSGDYIILPRDFEARNMPLKAIYLKDDYWIKGVNNHEITGKFGYSDLAPDAIELAATIIVSILINEHKSTDSYSKQSEKIGEYSISYEEGSKRQEEMQKVEDLLEPYEKLLL